MQRRLTFISDIAALALAALACSLTPAADPPPEPIATPVPFVPTAASVVEEAAPPAEAEAPAAVVEGILFESPGDGYRLRYPEHFTENRQTPEVMAFFGPPLDDSIEPVMAALFINNEGPTNGRDLQTVVDNVLAEAAGMPVTTAESMLGGEPAIVVEGLPGRSGSRQMYAIHNDTIYHLTVVPYDEGFPQARPDVDAVWNLVLSSFEFTN
jgi:hypothetical protein